MSVVSHPLSRHDAAVVAQMRAGLVGMKGSVRGPEARPLFDEIMEQVRAADAIETEQASVAGVQGFWVRPTSAPNDSVMLYLHGGAYVVGSAKAYVKFVGQIVTRTGIPAFVADYALAPEQPFPGAVEDALRAYIGLVELGFHRIAIGGDSAGGGLAFALATQVRAQKVAPRAIVAISPWTDLTLTSASMKTRDEADPIWSAAALADAARLYVRDADPHNALISPVYSDRDDLPPVLIHVGDADVLLDDAVRYAEGANSVEAHVWEGMLHVFPANAGLLEAADAALDDIGSFIVAHMAPRRDAG